MTLVLFCLVVFVCCCFDDGTARWNVLMEPDADIAGFTWAAANFPTLLPFTTPTWKYRKSGIALADWMRTSKACLRCWLHCMRACLPPHYTTATTTYHLPTKPSLPPRLGYFSPLYSGSTQPLLSLTISLLSLWVMGLSLSLPFLFSPSCLPHTHTMLAAAAAALTHTRDTHTPL